MNAPGASVPPGPPVPALRLLGTTWYRRGVGYWARRAWLLGVYLFLLGIVLLFTGGLAWKAATDLTGTVRVVVLAGGLVAVVASFISPVRLSRRRRRERQQGPATPAHTRSTRASSTSGLGVGVAAYGGSVVAGALVTLGAVFIFGYAVMLVADSVGRYLNNEEYFAVQAVERWHKHHRPRRG